MTQIPCQTPGCKGFSSKDNPDTLLFCQRCGWPLGKAELFSKGKTISFAKGSVGSFSIRVRNGGSGALRWDVADLEPGVRRMGRPALVAPGQEGHIDLEVDSERFQGNEIIVGLKLWDKHGKDATDYRLESSEEAFRQEHLTFTSRLSKVGPLVCFKRTLFFFPQTQKESFRITNHGETDLSVSIESSSGCRILIPFCPDLKGYQTSGQFTLGKGSVSNVEVYLDNEIEEATVTLTCPQVWSEPVVVEARRIEPELLEPPKYEYVVAIDFGTTKSAAMVYRQWHTDSEPEPVMWPKLDGTEEWYIPSEVRLHNGEPVDFGWRVGDSTEVVRSIKMHLQDDSELAKKCITYLLERIYERIAVTREPELLNKAQIVLSLPVLDDKERFERQQRLTLECALAAGRKYGLSPEQFVTYTEPECGLVDILDSMVKMDASERMEAPLPSDGKWLCVVDIGGGTTDISLTEFGVNEAGRPELRNPKVAGFSRAGDFIDQELFLDCLRRWNESGRLATGYPGAFTPEMLERPLSLKQETAPQLQSKIYEEIRRAKEYMYGQDPPRSYTLESFGIKRNHLHLDPADLDERVIRGAVKALFEGSEVIGELSFRRYLEEWQVPIDKIEFLFLTGGTSHLPVVLEILKSDYLQSPRLISFPNPEPRKNVVRGAALRPSLRLPNMLDFDLDLQFGDQRVSLAKGSIPGEEVSTHCHFQRGQSQTLRVTYRSKGSEGTLAEFDLALPNDAEAPRVTAEAHLCYDVKCGVKVRAEWLSGKMGVLLESTPLALFPKERS